MEGGERDEAQVRARQSMEHARLHRRSTTLRWENLHYSIPVSDPAGGPCSGATQEKPILRGLSGRIAPGSLVAIMGPTGSGKTSLLNCISGRCPVGGSLSGSILANEAPYGEAFLHDSAYVLQDDILFANLTVRETLMIAARLRLPESMEASEKEARAEGVISELGLTKVRDSFIGSEFQRGVSGGEKKRVNVGIELVCNPSVIFLDEPTTGLDSFQANNVVGMCRDIARAGRTVVATIHQPRSSIFEMLDYLVLLSEGRMAYFGPAKDAIGYFKGMGYECPEHYNPPDFFLDLISPDYRTPESTEKSLARIDDICTHYEALEAAGPQLPGADGGRLMGLGNQSADGEGGDQGKEGKVVVGGGQDGRDGHADHVPTYAAGIVEQFVVLFGRAWSNVQRNRVALLFSIFPAVLVSLILGASYSETGRGQRSIQDKLGSLFFVVINQSFRGLFASINTFTVENRVIKRERLARTYYVLPYYVAKIVAELPFRIINPIVFCTIFYWMVGYQSDFVHYTTFVCIMSMVTLVSANIGIILSCIFPSLEAASALAPLVNVVFLLYGGFYINSNSIPEGAVWIYWISFHRYAFEAAVKNEFIGLTFDCDAPAGQRCVSTGEEVVANLGLDDPDLGVWTCFLALVGLYLGSHVLGYTALELTGVKTIDMSTVKPAQENPERAHEETGQQ